MKVKLSTEAVDNYVHNMYILSLILCNRREDPNSRKKMASFYFNLKSIFYGFSWAVKHFFNVSLFLKGSCFVKSKNCG